MGRWFESSTAHQTTAIYMSSANSNILKWSKKNPSFKKIFLYYNLYIRNLKFIFNKSKSQFGEDKKIIKLFPKNMKGFYLDLGCFHPIRQSNTYLMYQRGWTGVNIDLNPLSIDLFNVARPKDINICAAVSDKNATETLYFDHSLSSLNTINLNHLSFLKKQFGLKKIKKKKIKTHNLANLLKIKKIKKIDFFNIDIEGSEFKVLKSFNYRYFKPKVICVEIIDNPHLKKNIFKKNQIIKLLKKNNYSLKFKSLVNYIFIKKKPNF